MTTMSRMPSNLAVKALPSVAGTRRKRRAPYLERSASQTRGRFYD